MAPLSRNPFPSTTHSAVRVDNSTPMKRMVALGLGYALLPFSGIHQEVAAGALSAALLLWMRAERVLVLPRGRPVSRATREAIAALKTICSGLTDAIILTAPARVVTRAAFATATACYGTRRDLCFSKQVVARIKQCVAFAYGRLPVIDFDELRSIAADVRIFIDASEDKGGALKAIVDAYDVVLGIFPAGPGMDSRGQGQRSPQSHRTDLFSSGFTHTAIAFQTREQAVALEQLMAA